MNFDHGTTTLGFKYQGGVLLNVECGQQSHQKNVHRIRQEDHRDEQISPGGRVVLLAVDCTYWKWVSDL